MTISINGIDQSVPSVEDYGRAVQDITALKAIGPSERFDKQHVYVEDQVRPYYFDLQSVTAESLPDIVLPDDAPAAGRWIKLPQMMGPPAAHGSTHKGDGSDPEPVATPAVSGDMSASDKTKLNTVATGADVTGANPPQAHIHGRGDLPVGVAYEDEANLFAVRQEFLSDIQARDQDGTPVADRRLRVIDGLWRATDIANLEGRHIAKTSLELLTNAEIAAAAAIDESKLDLFHQFFADQLDNPVNADWPVNALAPAVADSNNNGLTVRAFDDVIEEGVGFILRVPPGAINIKLALKGRAETGPPAARTVGVKLYQRGIPNDAAAEAWSAGTVLTDIDIPTTNEFFQYDAQTITLASLGITAGEMTQFELTRIDPTGGTELVGDWNLLQLEVGFS